MQPGRLPTTAISVIRSVSECGNRRFPKLDWGMRSLLLPRVRGGGSPSFAGVIASTTAQGCPLRRGALAERACVQRRKHSRGRHPLGGLPIAATRTSRVASFAGARQPAPLPRLNCGDLPQAGEFRRGQERNPRPGQEARLGDPAASSAPGRLRQAALPASPGELDPQQKDGRRIAQFKWIGSKAPRGRRQVAPWSPASPPGSEGEAGAVSTYLGQGGKHEQSQKDEPP
jgi:hypothetical protein